MPPPLTADQKADIRRAAAEVGPHATYVIARRCKVSPATVRKVLAEAADTSASLPPPALHPQAPGPPARLPDPAPAAGGPDVPALPEPFGQRYDAFRIDTPGRWLVLSDVHLPYHDRRAVETAVREGERAGCSGVLLNGDVFDFYAISRYSKEPDKPKLRDELLMGREFLRWLRSRFPQARVVFKEGNHDERFRAYLAERAPEVFDLEELDLPRVAHAERHGVEWVGGKRVIRLGKLPVVHGHEYRGSGGVNPARWLYLRTGSAALCGHFHQPSQHPIRTLDERELASWSAGCLCFLHPQYMPQNNWRHGYAVVEVAGDGGYQVANRSILRDGRVV